MYTSDRYWWAQLLAAFVALMATGAAPFWYLSQQLPLDQELNDSPIQDILLAIALGSVILLVAVIFAVRGFLGRIRQKHRWEALSGHLDAIPLAELRLDPAHAPDVTTEPLTLFWRLTTRSRGESILTVFPEALFLSFAFLAKLPAEAPCL